MSLLSRYFRKILLVVVTLFTLLLPACLLKSKETDIVTAPPPTISGGKIIADFDSARLRCGYQSASSVGLYELTCRVMAMQPDGSEKVATEIAPGTTLSWAPIEDNSDTFDVSNHGNCQSNDLSCKREVTILDMARGATVAVELGLKATGKEDRAETESVTFLAEAESFGATLQTLQLNPLSEAAVSEPVNASGALASRGLAAFKSTGTAKDGSDVSSAALLQGFQNKRKFSLGFKIGKPTSMCVRNRTVNGKAEAKLYFSSGDFIYVIDLLEASQNNMSLYAGSLNKSDIPGNHRLRISLDSPVVDCREDGVYIADRNRLLRVRDDETIIPSNSTSIVLGTKIRGISVAQNGFVHLLYKRGANSGLYILRNVVVNNQETFEALSEVEGIFGIDPAEHPVSIHATSADTLLFYDPTSNISTTSGISGSLSLHSGAAVFSRDPVTKPEAIEKLKLAVGNGEFFKVPSSLNQIERWNWEGPLAESIRKIAGNDLPAVREVHGDCVNPPQFSAASGVVVSAEGNIYFTETENNWVRMYNPKTCQLSTIAGTGNAGFSGDGGLATSAELNKPTGLAMGPDSTLYVADTNNEKIRRVSNGYISSLAFSPTQTPKSPRNIAVSPTGHLFISDPRNYRILRWGAASPYATGVRADALGVDNKGFLHFVEKTGTESYQLRIIVRSSPLQIRNVALYDENEIEYGSLTLKPERFQFLDNQIIVSDSNLRQVHRLIPRAQYSYTVSKYFGFNLSKDCGTYFKTQSAASDLENALKVSMDSFCMGKVRDISVRDFCDSSDPEKKGYFWITIAQTFEADKPEADKRAGSSNIVRIKRPCAGTSRENAE